MYVKTITLLKLTRLCSAVLIKMIFIGILEDELHFIFVEAYLGVIYKDLYIGLCFDIIIPGADPKSVLCAFYKQGLCTKGDKCKFSHDLTMGRKAEKRSVYEGENSKGKFDSSSLYQSTSYSRKTDNGPSMNRQCRQPF